MLRLSELLNRVFTHPSERPLEHLEKASQEVVHDLTNVRARVEVIARLLSKMNLDERNRKSERNK